jgi:GT2 family glycosyltransferase
MLDKMVRTMDDPSIGICGAKLLFPPTSTSPIRPAGKVQHVGLALNIRGEIVHPLVGWSADHPKCCVSRDVFATTGACYMIRRELFNKVGGFGQEYGLGTFEDADLCLKIRSLGLRVFLNAEAKAYHYVGASAEKKKVNFPLQENSMTFKNKWIKTPLSAWNEYEFF